MLTQEEMLLQMVAKSVAAGEPAYFPVMVRRDVIENLLEKAYGTQIQSAEPRPEAGEVPS